MIDSSFNPTDAKGLAAWFARAESHATRLRRRLATLGNLWRDLPEPGPQAPKSDPTAQGTGRTKHPPIWGQAHAGPGKRSRGYRRRNQG